MAGSRVRTGAVQGGPGHVAVPESKEVLERLKDGAWQGATGASPEGLPVAKAGTIQLAQ